MVGLNAETDTCHFTIHYLNLILKYCQIFLINLCNILYSFCFCKGPGKQGHIVAHDVSWAAQTGKQKTKSETFFVSPGKMCVCNKCCTHGQMGKHLCQQHCVCNNLSSFAWALRILVTRSNMFSCVCLEHLSKLWMTLFMYLCPFLVMWHTTQDFQIIPSADQVLCHLLGHSYLIEVLVS